MEDNLYVVIKTAIEKFLNKQLGYHFSESLWTHGNLAEGCGAVFNSYPGHYAPETGLGSTHLPGQKAVTFSISSHRVTITECFCFIDGEPASREQTALYVIAFTHSLESEAKKYAS